VSAPTVDNSCDVCGEIVLDDTHRPFMLGEVAKHGFDVQLCEACALLLHADQSRIARLMTRAWLRAERGRS